MNEKNRYKNNRNGNGFRGISSVIVFLVLIFGFTAASLLKKEIAFSENENRVLQQKPQFSMERLFDGTFTKEYETYVTDQFVGRDRWIAVKVYAEKALQKKEINGVYFGKDHYLIQQHEETKVDQTLVKKNLDRLQAFIDRYQEKLTMNVLIVPTSSNVLVDKLPSYAPEYDQMALMKTICDRVGENHYIDVSQVLDEHKDEYIYYRTDHHWTSLGAFYAYQAAADKLGIVPDRKEDYTIKEVANDFLGTTYSKVNIKTEPDTIELYEQKNGQTYEVSINHGESTLDGLFDLGKLKDKDKYPVFLGGNNPYVEITGGEKNGKTLLVIKDSFAHTFVPFLASHYEKIIMIDYRYFNMSTQALMEQEKVTDLLFLYNAMNFVEDKNLLKLLK